MTDAIAAAESALAEARRQNSAAQSAAYEAEKAVREAHAPALREARAAVYAAEAALKLAQSEAAPDHEWEGKTVYKIDRHAPRWGGKHTDTLVIGTLFTYRPGVDLGPGHKYTYTKVGSAWVRLSKKDGTPGAKCEPIGGKWGGEHRWALSEAEALKIVEARAQ